MLPLVSSTTVPPGRSRPSRSASATIRSATRSLTLPPGENISSLSATRPGRPAASRSSATSGVWPIAPSAESSIGRPRADPAEGDQGGRQDQQDGGQAERPVEAVDADLPHHDRAD